MERGSFPLLSFQSEDKPLGKLSLQPGTDFKRRAIPFGDHLRQKAGKCLQLKDEFTFIQWESNPGRYLEMTCQIGRESHQAVESQATRPSLGEGQH